MRDDEEAREQNSGTAFEWGPQGHGTLEERYAVYRDQMVALGQPAKTFDEWLND
ncbi:hypothetical protein [Thioalkalivibrio sp. ALE16]|uniref:hypothetical protein n=1 Tax=Thioalkalivibrio sp. ALE16 TaxID=1158172 RepID=UPI000380CD67|nr:hypothetical protein [Thioalkalivibrio sp. ALE16]